MSALRPPLPPGPYVIAGLARSGVAAARVLRERGEAVVGIDSRAELPDRDALAALGVQLALGGDGVDALPESGTVIKSPGVPPQAPVVVAARERGMAVLGEVEFAWRLLPNPFVAITGSNGKTTTTELVGHLHRVAGVAVEVAGNVGTAVSGLVGQADPEAVVVCECSSFQLEDTERFAPDVAVLLNLAEDHLDRHGTFEAYREAKLRAFRRQGESQVAVVPLGWQEDVPGAARRVTFGANGDVHERDGALWWRGERVVDVDALRLRGAHNVENALAALAVCAARKLALDALAEGLRTFGGVPHRLEEVARHDGVVFVNDSKATNVDAAVTGLRSFPGGVHVILGGRTKGGAWTELVEAVRERAVAAYLIGEAGPEIADALGKTGVALHASGDLATAVEQARAAARDGEVVLLSPACTSFDQFTDFEARGDAFRALVA